MTESELLPVTLGGHEFMVKKLTDVQLMHLARHARILTLDNVGYEAKLEAMDRMFLILHSVIPDPEQVQFLVGLEEAGKVDLGELTAIARIFMEAQQQTPVVRRRGRPRKSVS